MPDLETNLEDDGYYNDNDTDAGGYGYDSEGPNVC